MSDAVKLVWATPDADKLLAYIARVSNPANQANEKIEGLLRYMEREGHVSPFTMANMCVEINTTRAIGRQLIRHWTLAVQEFCIAGDSKITLWSESGKFSYVAIEDLYRYQTDARMRAVCGFTARVYDEQQDRFVRAKIKEVFKTGKKPVFEVAFSDGKKVKTTGEHKFLSRAGWKPLKEFAVGDLAAVNGQPLYMDRGWMVAEKAKTIASATGGVQAIADSAGVSYHTIRKWLRVHGLQFSHQEALKANGGRVWNRGLPAEQQPMYGKTHSTDTRERMRASSRQGEESEFFTSGVFRPLRQRCADWTGKHRLRLLRVGGCTCKGCGVALHADAPYFVDHIQPVSTHPELAFTESNLQTLCETCHKKKSQAEAKAVGMTKKWREIISIVAVGEEETYDMEVDHSSHNYIANKILVHNSQRYQDVSALGDMVIVECRMQDAKNRQNSLECTDEETAAWFQTAQENHNRAALDRYNEALKRGIAKEQARCFLPEGNTPSRLYFNGNFRSWIHFLRSRLHASTQKETRLIAQGVAAQFKAVAPVTYAAFFEAV